jgi:hypothetical protein
MDVDKNKELVLKLLEEVRDLKEENQKLEKLVEIYMTETAATLEDMNRSYKKIAGISKDQETDKWAVALSLDEHKKNKKNKKKFLGIF